MSKKIFIGGIVVAIVIVLLIRMGPGENDSAIYEPIINPSDFTTVIDNPYFALPVGKTMVFEGETAEGLERIEISIPGDTKMIMGVETLVYRDTVTIAGELVEDTYDYLAQDTAGNVWYFGEDVDNYENGQLKDHDGAWIAGIDGAQPGIWFPANPRVGDSYRQEYYRGEAEDMADIVAVGETVAIQLGTYNDCVKTKDYTPLEPDVLEYKYYCSEVGGLVLEEKPEEGERVELIEITIRE